VINEGGVTMLDNKCVSAIGNNCKALGYENTVRDYPCYQCKFFKTREEAEAQKERVNTRLRGLDEKELYIIRKKYGYRLGREEDI
jgi:hypothetical protein